MGRQDVDLYNIGITNEELQRAVISLRQDFDAHNHDGNSTKSFQTLIAETVSARALTIRKTYFGDSQAGFWAGIVDGDPRIHIGDSTSFVKYQNGTLSATGITVSGYIEVGGAADDVNDNATTISGGKITANSITSDRMSVSQLSAISANLGTITAGTITGVILQTASSGQRILLTSASTNQIRFFNSDDTEIGQVQVTGNDTDGSFKVTSVGGAELELEYAVGSSSVANAYLGGGGGVLQATGTSSVGVVGMYRTSSSSEFFHIARSASTTKLDTDLDLDADWIPFTDSTYDLGSSSKYWALGYIDTLTLSTSLVYKSINQPVLYFGYCSGTTISLDNNSFTLTNPSTGNYTITHNLGTTNYVVVATAFAASGGGAAIAKVAAFGSNSFDIITFDDTGTATDYDFIFQLMLIT